ncbi:hypothetical protein KP509_01G006700 [Ceratopteris richardii]|uniref:PX domain-containing protein n=1 Tax=Ceratopteris richardii TaxID=49495 RepID=A0A8T2VH45_CERRI|nr:hypothetical protein KP509_01G006700 [Ceratopteris richardii]KAH7445394.1 hypothetical protein KP509_01G006700 [Ceratopteris richardii]KAH7445395.1 hypothetical protein KP509_01G006700 [Ceratopteris richardii]KAH7445396.1 hypothetical protein KP509_01G006700 [Ceratopteris richardii]KAH7445397.1 hypothetical protein KP509_01G006700 [Ceratopteris richardii]
MKGSDESDRESSCLPLTDGMESVILDEPLSHSSLKKNDYDSTALENSAGSGTDLLSTLTNKPDSMEETYRMSFSRSSTSRNRDDVFVEPPSYADAVFTPYTGDAITGNGSSRDYGNHMPVRPSSLSSSSYSDYLYITVSQPQKVQDNSSSSIIPGSNTYFTYLIVTQTNMPQYEGSDFSVRRRFRDVVTLADRLAEAYRGYFIPARPDKSIVESQVMQKQEFIEQRRAAIEKYLCRLANHPILRMSDELRLFLQSQGKLPLIATTDFASRMLDGAANLPRQLFGEGSVLMSPEDVAQPAKGGRDLVRLFKELKQSVTNEWGGVRQSMPEEDKEFLDRKEKLADLERFLTEASQKAEILVTAQQDVGEIMGELGLTFTKLAKFEGEEATLNMQRAHAMDAKRLATAAVQASRFYREANSTSIRHLDQLHENLSVMQSMNVAFKDRATALLTVQTLNTEVSSVNTRIEKLKVASSKVFGGDKARDRKIEELKEALLTIEESRDGATREYNRIKETNMSELERFDQERERNFSEMIKGYILTQVGYAEKIANVWSKAAEEFNPQATLPNYLTTKSS